MSFLKNNLVGVENNSDNVQPSTSKTREEKLQNLINKGERSIKHKVESQFCGHCGSKIETNAKFCSSCGERVVTDFHKPVNGDSHKIEKEKKVELNKGELRPASQGKRLLHLILDYFVFLYVFGFLVGLFLYFIDMYEIIEDSNETVLGLILALIYFLFFEGIWHKTPAKFLTKTKVVMKDGSVPTFANIIGRTLSRFIPFEAFSFLGGNYPVGIHDNLSKTLVVASNYTEDDVKNIVFDKEKKKKSTPVKNIILIIVIVIIVFWIIGVLYS